MRVNNGGLYLSVGWNRGLGYSPGPHSARFREFRRLFHQFMGPRPSQDPHILELQESSARQLLVRLLNKPDEFVTHVRQYVLDLQLFTGTLPHCIAQNHGGIYLEDCIWIFCFSH